VAERAGEADEAERLLEEQQRYYRERAAEYDDWFFRRGRYDLGADFNEQWTADVATVRRALAQLAPYGEALELACGTGNWTSQLAAGATSVTAVDGAAEMIEISRAKSAATNVTHEVADLFAWRGAGRYDTIFFGFWLSHVPPERFVEFWQNVGRALAPGGRAFFVDSLAYDATGEGRSREGVVERRRLNDGRQFSIVKVIYEPERLGRELADLGWRCEITTSGRFFIYGSRLRATA